MWQVSDWQLLLFCQHDIDSKLTANAVKPYLETHWGILSLMDRPSQYPDLSGVEAVWNHHDRKLNKKALKNFKNCQMHSSLPLFFRLALVNTF